MGYGKPVERWPVIVGKCCAKQNLSADKGDVALDCRTSGKMLQHRAPVACSQLADYRLPEPSMICPVAASTSLQQARTASKGLSRSYEPASSQSGLSAAAGA